MMNAIQTESFEEIHDLLYTISNAAVIGTILIDMSKGSLLPTILEYIFEQSQKLVDYCVKDDE